MRMNIDLKIRFKEYAKEFGFSLVREEDDGVMFCKGLLTIIISESVEEDRKRWLHISLARPNKYPSYDEIKYIKDLFLENIKAIMVFPKKERHVNIHPYCFHLFACLEGDSIPDFDRGIGTI